MARKSRGSQKMYRVALLFFILFKFIGLATFSVNNQTVSKKKCPRSGVSFTATKFGILYNVLFGCSMIASNYFTIPILYNSEFEHKTTIMAVIQIFHGILGSLVVSLILLCYCTNRSILVAIVNYLIQIEDALRRLQQPLNWKHIVYILLVVYVLNSILCIALVVTDYVAFQTDPVAWLSSVVPATFVGLVFIQYFSLLTLADATFANINTVMQNLCRSRAVDACPNSLVETRRVFVDRSCIRFFVQIRDVHDSLCDVTNKMIEFYSSPILIGISFTFSALLYNIYYLFQPFVVEPVHIDIVIFVNTLLWIIFLLYPLGLMTTKITKIIKEIENTGNIVHVLLNRTIDREARAELKQFSLQLLHRKMKFTANGFFALDNTLFQSVLSTVATYMIILLQFQVGMSVPNSNRCNCTQ